MGFSGKIFGKMSVYLTNFTMTVHFGLAFIMKGLFINSRREAKFILYLRFQLDQVQQSDELVNVIY